MADERVRFGTTELSVPRVCQGTAFRHLERKADSPSAEAVLHHCLDRGINFFDSAVSYGWGGSEELLGKVIAGRRGDVVVCTKVPRHHLPVGDEDPKPAAYTRDFLAEMLEGSLRRLRTDYVDLYLLHQPDDATSVDEICASMETLVRSGKVRYWGVSNHSGEVVEALCSCAEGAGTAPPAGCEDYYNIGGYYAARQGRPRVRKLEREMFPVLAKRGLGLLAFSPMDAGALSPENPPEGAPFAALCGVLDDGAARLKTTRGALCAAWVLAHDEVTSVLSGAESPAHVDEMLAGALLELPPEELRRLNEASATYSTTVEPKD